MEEEGRSVRLKGLAVWQTTRRFITWWIRDTEWGDFYNDGEQMTKLGSFVGASHAKGPFSAFVPLKLVDFSEVVYGYVFH
jgi:hypothetical protein